MPGFGEHDPGPDCDGMSFDEYIERYGAGWWEGDPFGTSFPGGETIAAFQFRIGQAIRRTIDAYADKTVVVVCHGGVVDAALRLALKSPATGGYEIHTLNTSITEIHLIKDNLWRLIRYNDVGHLGRPPHTTTPRSPDAYDARRLKPDRDYWTLAIMGIGWLDGGRAAPSSMPVATR